MRFFLFSYASGYLSVRLVKEFAHYFERRRIWIFLYFSLKEKIDYFYSSIQAKSAELLVLAAAAVNGFKKFDLLESNVLVKSFVLKFNQVLFLKEF